MSSLRISILSIKSIFLHAGLRHQNETYVMIYQHTYFNIHFTLFIWTVCSCFCYNIYLWCGSNIITLVTWIPGVTNAFSIVKICYQWDTLVIDIIQMDSQFYKWFTYIQNPVFLGSFGIHQFASCPFKMSVFRFYIFWEK